MASNAPEGIKSFEPPRRVLMGPGPSDVHPRVLAAMARPTIGHLDPLAGKVWRIGLMGAASTPQNVTLCLEALETMLAEATAG